MLHLCRAQERYMILPIVADAPVCKLAMGRAGEPPFCTLDVAFAPNRTDAIRMYVDLARFNGCTLSFTLSDSENAETDFSPAFCAERGNECLYHTPYRPMIHYTVRYGWSGAPFGVAYADGAYHMYYPHNPAGLCAGNIRWGHAVSGDLVHWCEWDDALFPNEYGNIPYGSVVADPADLLHIGNGQFTPLLFCAAADSSNTAAEPMPFLAYSADGGQTIEKSPVPVRTMPEFMGNGTPGLTWCDEMDCWLAVAHASGYEYRIYRMDMTETGYAQFSLVQSLTLPGDTGTPDFYPLDCAGEQFWIFSGASDAYLVGKIADGKFVPVQEARFLRYGGGKCAARTFSDSCGRTIRMAYGEINPPGACFAGQMLFPCALRLDLCSDCYRLAAEPIDELDMLRVDTKTWEKTATEENPLIIYLNGGAYEAIIGWEEDTPAMTAEIYGLEIRILTEENILELPGCVLPLSHDYTGREIRLLIDASGIEAFADHGRIYATISCLPDMKKRQLTLKPDNPVKACDVAVTISPLGDIWE